MQSVPRSTIPGIAWPALPSPHGAQLLALQFQFEQSQWWSPDALRARQMAQLATLLHFARDTVPYYREALPEIDPRQPLAPDDWLKLPRLTRQNVLLKKNDLVSRDIPPSHGAVSETSTSGSSGRPVVVLKTELAGLFWQAITLREHLWHKRDFSGKLACIRNVQSLSPGTPANTEGWGAATNAVYASGPGALLHINTDTAQQARWLAQVNPHYLLTFPTNLRDLLRHLKHKPSNLKQVLTLSESLPDDLREVLRDTWGIGLADMYSSQEIGYMALQCPENDHYHVQSEHVLVEVLRADNSPCAVGETGRVVVTALHNFAMPLIRYEILDYAEVGAPCSCGRGLPVLKRILGRTRNLLSLPDGTRHMPSLSAAMVRATQIAPVEQAQLIQHSVEQLELKLAVTRPLLAAETRQLTEAFQAALNHPFQIQITCADHIPRNASGKFEDFISHVVPS